MHVEKYKGAGVAPVSNHNARVYESRGYRRENIDSSLSGENYRLGPDRGPAKEWVNARVAALGLKRRPRSDAVLMCEWVVTLPESERGGEREFFEAAYSAMAARYGADNVVSCWVHRDEPGASMDSAAWARAAGVATDRFSAALGGWRGRDADIRFWNVAAEKKKARRRLQADGRALQWWP